MKKKFIFSGVVLILCLPLCVAAGYLYSFRIPREYYSKVTMEVEPDNYRTRIFDGDKFNQPTDGEFVPTQFSILQSKEMLYPVIDELKLVEKWAAGNVKLPKEQIYFQLLERIDVKSVKNTDLIEIGVYSHNPQEAADIANAIAMQYRQRRIDDNQKMFDLNLSELKDEVEKQRQKVESAHAAVLRIWQEHQGDAEGGEPQAGPPKGDVYTQETEARARGAELASELDQISKMTPDEMTENSVPLLNLVTVMDAKILPEYQNIKAQEATLINAGAGENDPRLKDLRVREEAYRERLKIRIETLRKDLTTRLQIARDDLSNREKDIEAAEEQLFNANPEYFNARKKYLEEKKKLDDAETRYLTQKMELRISFQPAKIWEKAEPATTPARPNVPMILLVAKGIGLIFAIPGVVVLVVGLCMND